MKRRVNEVHIGALQYTFVSRANWALKFVADSWNSHPLSIQKNRSSEQLWILWMNSQKGELCTYGVIFILIPQVKCFHFLDFQFQHEKEFMTILNTSILNTGLCGDKVLSSKR